MPSTSHGGEWRRGNGRPDRVHLRWQRHHRDCGGRQSACHRGGGRGKDWRDRNRRSQPGQHPSVESAKAMTGRWFEVRRTVGHRVLRARSGRPDCLALRVHRRQRGRRACVIDEASLVDGASIDDSGRPARRSLLRFLDATVAVGLDRRVGQCSSSSRDSVSSSKGSRFSNSTRLSAVRRSSGPHGRNSASMSKRRHQGA